MGKMEGSPGSIINLADYRSRLAVDSHHFTPVNPEARLNDCLGYWQIFGYIASASAYSCKPVYSGEQIAAIRKHLGTCCYCRHLFSTFLDEIICLVDSTSKAYLSSIGFIRIAEMAYLKIKSTNFKRASLVAVK